MDRARPREPGPGPPSLAAVAAAVRDAGRALACERCWLYARDPATRCGIALVRWLRDEAIPDVPEDLRTWTREDPGLAARDPLFARALAGVPVDVVEDSHAARVDRALEDALRHRAFVHLNLHANGGLWGTLQPGMTAAPRRWTAAERAHLLALRPSLGAQVAALLRARGTDAASLRLVGAAEPA